MCFSKIRILCCLGIIALSTALLSCSSATDILKTDLAVVATVDDVPIYQSEIDVRPEEVEAFIAERAIDKLDSRIMQIIEDHAIQSLEIRASKAEVRNEVDSKFEQAGIDEAQALRIAEMYRALVAGLEKWHKDKTQSAKIYEKYLAEFMTQAQWHQWQKSCPLPKDITKIKKQIPEDIDDMKENSLQSSERDILHSKLVAHVTAGVRVQENEIRATYADKYRGDSNKPAFSAVKDNIRSELLQKKKQQAMTEWRKSRFQQVSIQIKNKRIRELWETKHRSVPLTTGPQNPVVTVPVSGQSK